jgi:transposase-like protein
VLQARALLMSADGEAIYEVARKLDVASNSVRRWRRRFAADGVEGIGVIAPGRGRRSWLPEGTVAKVVSVTMNELPDDGSTQWSSRSLAKHLGISKDTVARIWKDHGLQSWKTDTFKVSTDPHFEEKLVGVVGLYMNPPQRAVVFSFDEKTQVQALDRTQPSLPMKKGRGTVNDDDPRLQASRHDGSLSRR